jgi:hypothetical protein
MPLDPIFIADLFPQSFRVPGRAAKVALEARLRDALVANAEHALDHVARRLFLGTGCRLLGMPRCEFDEPGYIFACYHFPSFTVFIPVPVLCYSFNFIATNSGFPGSPIFLIGTTTCVLKDGFGFLASTISSYIDGSCMVNIISSLPVPSFCALMISHIRHVHLKSSIRSRRARLAMPRAVLFGRMPQGARITASDVWRHPVEVTVLPYQYLLTCSATIDTLSKIVPPRVRLRVIGT